MHTNAIVLANGSIENPEVISQRLSELSDCYVIAADGGIQVAEMLSLPVDLIIGDLDSSSEELLSKFAEQSVTIERHSAEKDETDLELALLKAIDMEPGRVIMLGGLGGRLDMSLANIQTLAHPALVGTRIEIWHGQQTGRLLRPPGGSIQGKPGDTLSLIPMEGEVTGLVSSGLAYPLEDDTFSFGVTRGVSNVFTHPVAKVNITSGLLFIVHTPGAA
jgi:thiamine pyrophosphokinase